LALVHGKNRTATLIMKILSCFFYFFVLISLCSCSKNHDAGPGSPSDDSTTAGTQLYRIFQGVSSDINEDTVWLVNYNDSGRISSLFDSSHNRTMTPSYNDKGQLELVMETYNHGAGFQYNSDGALTDVYTTNYYHFDYTDGIVSRKTMYNEAGNSVYRYFDYTVTDGNITTIKEYSASAVLLSTSTLTYTDESNLFKDISLFTYRNEPGTDPVIQLETYFNKNLLKTVNQNGTITSSTEYIFNKQSLPVKAITDYHLIDYPGVFTRQFMYR
jgi:hypothetical protein